MGCAPDPVRAGPPGTRGCRIQPRYIRLAKEEQVPVGLKGETSDHLITVVNCTVRSRRGVVAVNPVGGNIRPHNLPGLRSPKRVFAHHAMLIRKRSDFQFSQRHNSPQLTLNLKP